MRGVHRGRERQTTATTRNQRPLAPAIAAPVPFIAGTSRFAVVAAVRPNDTPQGRSSPAELVIASESNRGRKRPAVKVVHETIDCIRVGQFLDRLPYTVIRNGTCRFYAQRECGTEATSAHDGWVSASREQEVVRLVVEITPLLRVE